jgi:FixJ family two-component response regulator
VPNCLVLDLNLPDLSGLEVQGLICGERPETPIIFISGHVDVLGAVQAMKAGACEYFLKPLPNHELLDAIESCIELSHAELSRRSQFEQVSDRYRSLSFRERQVMSLVTEGLMNKQIAFKLGISEVTVKAHRGQVMRKMNASSLPDLVMKAARLGMLTRDHDVFANRLTRPGGRMHGPNGSPTLADGFR